MNQYPPRDKVPVGVAAPVDAVAAASPGFVADATSQ